MIEVVKEGKTEFNGICLKCECEFTYNISDLLPYQEMYYTKCPNCGDRVWHDNRIESTKHRGKPCKHVWVCDRVNTKGSYYTCIECGISVFAPYRR